MCMTRTNVFMVGTGPDNVCVHVKVLIKHHSCTSNHKAPTAVPYSRSSDRPLWSHESFWFVQEMNRLVPHCSRRQRSDEDQFSTENI